MNSVQLRDAKANLSKLVDAAERGDITTITRHGKPAALIVPVDALKRRESAGRTLGDKEFADFLLSFPVNLEEILTEEDRPRIRDVDL